MKSFLIIAFCVAVAAAVPLDVVQDEDGQDYLLIPVNRERREVKWGAKDRAFGASHTGTVVNNGNHRVDTTVGASKNWGSTGLKPDSFGGRVDYSHNPSGSSAFASANKARGYGTDVAAGGKYNVAQGKNWAADVSGQYGKHLGGPGGNGKSQFGAGVNVHGNF